MILIKRNLFFQYLLKKIKRKDIRFIECLPNYFSKELFFLFMQIKKITFIPLEKFALPPTMCKYTTVHKIR